MKHDFEAIVDDFTSKYFGFVPPIGVLYAIVGATGIQDDDEYVKFVVPIEEMVQWNGKRVRVTIEEE